MPGRARFGLFELAIRIQEGSDLAFGVAGLDQLFGFRLEHHLERNPDRVVAEPVRVSFVEIGVFCRVMTIVARDVVPKRRDCLELVELEERQVAGVGLFASQLDGPGRLGEVLRVIRPRHDQDQTGRLKLLAAIRLVGREPHRDFDCPAFDLGEPRGRQGIGVELPLLLLKLAGPVNERMGVVFIDDLGLLELARGEPLVLFAQLGGDLSDGLLVFERQLRAAKVRCKLPDGRFGEWRPASGAASFSSAGVVDLSAIALSRVVSVSATIRRLKGR